MAYTQTRHCGVCSLKVPILTERLLVCMQAKPGSNVHISNAMPDIDSLMQQWPLEVEQQLHTVKLPDASLVSCCWVGGRGRGGGRGTLHCSRRVCATAPWWVLPDMMCRTACTMFRLQFMLWLVCIASSHTDCPALSNKLLNIL